MAGVTLKLVLAGSVGIWLLASIDGAACGETPKAARAAGRTPAAAGLAKTAAESEEQERGQPVAEKNLPAAPRVERSNREEIVEGRTAVIRLKHAPAMDISKTLGEFLLATGLDETAVVVPDALSNTLLLRAPDERIEEIQRMVEQLDQPPKMVHIRAWIAEVHCDPERPEETASDSAAGETATAKQDEGKPSDSEKHKASLATARRELDLSVLDISEGAECLQEQLRALEENGRLEILARPQMMTLENQAAFIQVGSRVPRITGTTIQSRGQANQVQLENVGLILGVTPRVSDEDTVVMEIDLEMSDLRENEDVVVSSIPDGPAIHASEITVTTAQSTVAVASGKTILLGGMTTKSKQRRIEMVMLLSATIVE